MQAFHKVPICSDARTYRTVMKTADSVLVGAINDKNNGKYWL